MYLRALRAQQLLHLNFYPVPFKKILKIEQHIFLTGFMGSGKSTAGSKLASYLKFKFIDLDAYIEKKENKSIPEIFEEKGEKGFRDVETECLNEVVKFKGPCVISLGGGTICFGNNLETVKNNGTLIYIELQPVTLAQRIRGAKNQRPLLKNLSDEDLLKNIEEILGERKKFYHQAHITVNGLNLTPQLLHQKILGLLKENIG
jgi:shikimate kinase